MINLYDDEHGIHKLKEPKILKDLINHLIENNHWKNANAEDEPVNKACLLGYECAINKINEFACNYNKHSSQVTK